MKNPGGSSPPGIVQMFPMFPPRAQTALGHVDERWQTSPAIHIPDEARAQAEPLTSPGHLLFDLDPFKPDICRPPFLARRLARESLQTLHSLFDFLFQPCDLCRVQRRIPRFRPGLHRGGVRGGRGGRGGGETSRRGKCEWDREGGGTGSCEGSGGEKHRGTEEMRGRSEGLQLVSRDTAIFRLSKIASRVIARVKKWDFERDMARRTMLGAARCEGAEDSPG